MEKVELIDAGIDMATFLWLRRQIHIIKSGMVSLGGQNG